MSNIFQSLFVLLGLILFGNKCDLADQRRVPLKQARDYAETIGAEYIEMSAVTQEGIDSYLLLSACLQFIYIFSISMTPCVEPDILATKNHQFYDTAL